MWIFDIFQIVTLQINAHISADNDKYGRVDLKMFAFRFSLFAYCKHMFLTYMCFNFHLSYVLILCDTFGNCPTLQI